MLSLAGCILSVILGFSYAQVFGTGKCPTVTVKSGFDINQYLGDWYEIYKFKAGFENDQVCNKANYKLKDNGHIDIFNSGFGPDGKQTSAEGDAYIPEKSDAARLKLRFASAAPYGDYWVLDTDYETYTLIFSCTDLLFGATHFEFAWILAREKTISDDIKNKLFKQMVDFKINTSNFLKTNQTSVYCTN
ncbi:APOD [Mytilus coruscus]|uniref:Apolipoprotein D n=1 Tax=Mytilus coruscus TaxID=42192 RepID=A0A6J8CLD6_MYTCO|nr:APOD [Mytilus coruscus]